MCACFCACLRGVPLQIPVWRRRERHGKDEVDLGSALERYGQTRQSCGRGGNGGRALGAALAAARGQRRRRQGSGRFSEHMMQTASIASSTGRARNVLSQHRKRGQENPIDYYYERGDFLGSGAFGTVRRWTVRDRSGSSVSLDRESSSSPAGSAFGAVASSAYEASPAEEVAVKHLPWSKISGGCWGCCGDQEQEDLIRAELEVLIRLDNPYIIKFREWFEDPSDGIYFVMELCDGSSFNVLLDDICKKDEDARMRSMPYCRRFFRQVVYAVSYLHSLTPPIIHRDLKPDNILLTRRNPCESTCNVKIIDFGLTRQANVEFALKSQMSGTPLFMAPECILPARYFAPGKYEFTPEMDVWALGIIFGWIVTSVEHGKQYHLMLDEACGDGFEVDPFDLLMAFSQKQPWNRDLLIGSSPSAFELADRVLVYPPEAGTTASLEGKFVPRATAAELLSMAWVLEGEKETPAALAQVVADQIRTYHQLGEFDRLLLSLVAEHANCNRAQILSRAFRSLDTDNTGRLTKENLLIGLKSLHAENSVSPLEEEEVDSLFRTLDRDENGALDYHEWMAVTIGRHMLQQDEAILRAFGCLDFSNAGRISRGDLEEVLGSEQAGRLMANRKFLDFDDFKAMVKKIAEQRALILTTDVPAPASQRLPAAGEETPDSIKRASSVFSIPSISSIRQFVSNSSPTLLQTACTPTARAEAKSG
eukprot:TRINITY_DN727_c0_g3_i3.p1 TRINITY_DN727_c0_g3~~TRINITY_DN727_c0_g3_i3.p1  ORF type:complete len:728 (-),score=159.12 TRINITY_DN727_c0_g3_i3:465-2588(-)